MKAFYILCLFSLVSCSPPEDSKDSYADAMQHGLKVGLVNNPPFTVYNEGNATGTEVKIIKDFARKESMDVKFIHGSESTLIKQLENYEIHLLIGGFDKKTVWKKKAGLTTRYNGKNVFLIAKGENKLLYRLEEALLKQKQ